MFISVAFNAFISLYFYTVISHNNKLLYNNLGPGLNHFLMKTGKHVYEVCF